MPKMKVAGPVQKTPGQATTSEARRVAPRQAEARWATIDSMRPVCWTKVERQVQQAGPCLILDHLPVH